ncbi:UNKNOWN [Stylonychia lemnae]|uniref:Uncharacterized protein n=1 Tax=Stylonychia lemnae TaxID=5949 RepID=A0A078A1R4_STYLE|nr:UNKNOWN [Stylonychia lemnae]|eukprot:CDW74719.1 UNKNOWN [Stylonychia lemnae]
MQYSSDDMDHEVLDQQSFIKNAQKNKTEIIEILDQIETQLNDENTLNQEEFVEIVKQSSVLEKLRQITDQCNTDYIREILLEKDQVQKNYSLALTELKNPTKNSFIFQVQRDNKSRSFVEKSKFSKSFKPQYNKQIENKSLSDLSSQEMDQDKDSDIFEEDSNPMKIQEDQIDHLVSQCDDYEHQLNILSAKNGRMLQDLEEAIQSKIEAEKLSLQYYDQLKAQYLINEQLKSEKLRIIEEQDEMREQMDQMLQNNMQNRDQILSYEKNMTMANQELQTLRQDNEYLKEKLDQMCEQQDDLYDTIERYETEYQFKIDNLNKEVHHLKQTNQQLEKLAFRNPTSDQNLINIHGCKLQKHLSAHSSQFGNLTSSNGSQRFQTPKAANEHNGSKSIKYCDLQVIDQDEVSSDKKIYNYIDSQNNKALNEEFQAFDNEYFRKQDCFQSTSDLNQEIMLTQEHRKSTNIQEEDDYDKSQSDNESNALQRYTDTYDINENEEAKDQDTGYFNENNQMQQIKQQYQEGRNCSDMFNNLTQERDELHASKLSSCYLLQDKNTILIENQSEIENNQIKATQMLFQHQKMLSQNDVNLKNIQNDNQDSLRVPQQRFSYQQLQIRTHTPIDIRNTDIMETDQHSNNNTSFCRLSLSKTSEIDSQFLKQISTRPSSGGNINQFKNNLHLRKPLFIGNFHYQDDLTQNNPEAKIDQFNPDQQFEVNDYCDKTPVKKSICYKSIGIQYDEDDTNDMSMFLKENYLNERFPTIIEDENKSMKKDNTDVDRRIMKAYNANNIKHFTDKKPQKSTSHSIQKVSRKYDNNYGNRGCCVSGSPSQSGENCNIF